MRFNEVEAALVGVRADGDGYAMAAAAAAVAAEEGNGPIRWAALRRRVPGATATRRASRAPVSATQALRPTLTQQNMRSRPQRRLRGLLRRRDATVVASFLAVRCCAGRVRAAMPAADRKTRSVTWRPRRAPNTTPHHSNSCRGGRRRTTCRHKIPGGPLRHCRTALTGRSHQPFRKHRLNAPANARVRCRPSRGECVDEMMLNADAKWGLAAAGGLRRPVRPG